MIALNTPTIRFAFILAFCGQLSAKVPDFRPLRTPQHIQEHNFAGIKKLAGAGVDVAQSSLGDFYATGTGVPKDYTEAANWYRKAAE